MAEEENDYGMITTLDSKLMKARCRCLTDHAFFGTIAARFKWKESEEVPTMGVAIIDGDVSCFYNAEFCNKFDVKELVAIIIHEIEHIIKLHPTRLGTRDPELWNIAADCIVNGRKSNPSIPNITEVEKRIKLMNKDELEKLIKAGKKTKHKTFNEKDDAIVWMPQDINENITTEELYDKFVNDPKSIPLAGDEGEDQEGNGEGQGEGEGEGDEKEGKGNGKEGKGGGKEGKGKPKDGKGDKEGKGKSGKGGDKPRRYRGFDSHEMWKKSNASEEEARQIVKELVKAGLQAGNAPNHLKQDIKKLNESKINWRNMFKEFLAKELGNHRLTYSRLHRRMQEPFGFKGKSNHAQISMTIMVDTSGSVDDKRLHQFFTEVEKLSHNFKITLLTFTSQAWPHKRYRKGDWKTLKTHCRGGTNFQAAFDYIEKNKIVGKVNLVVSDGECGIPPKPKWPIVWVLCPHAEGIDRWRKEIKYGKIVEIPRDGI